MADKMPLNDVYEAGRLAVRLLKELAARTTLHSDMQKIEAEISRIEKVFNEKERGAGRP